MVCVFKIFFITCPSKCVMVYVQSKNLVLEYKISGFPRLPLFPGPYNLLSTYLYLHILKKKTPKNCCSISWQQR